MNINKAKKFLEEKGFTICYIGIYGSQNYGLDINTDDYKSDFDEALVNNFKKLLKATGAKIVISSSWRHNMKRCENSFKEAGLDWDLVIGRTPDGLGYGRGNEVLIWINEYHQNCKDGEHIKKWIMIDDDDFDAKCVKRLGKFIHTPKIALTLKKVDEAINLLNN